MAKENMIEWTYCFLMYVKLLMIQSTLRIMMQTMTEWLIWFMLFMQDILPITIIIKFQTYGQSLVLLLSQISLMVKVSVDMESAMNLMVVIRHLRITRKLTV